MPSPARIVEPWLHDAHSTQRTAPEIGEAWRHFPMAAMDRVEYTFDQVCEGLANERRTERYVIFALAVTVVLDVVASLFMPSHGDRLPASVSEAIAWIISQYPLAPVLTVVTVALVVRLALSMRRIRDYENRMAYMSEMDVCLSAAVTFERPEAIDKSFDTLESAQKNGGVLSPLASAERPSSGLRAVGAAARAARAAFK